MCIVHGSGGGDGHIGVRCFRLRCLFFPLYSAQAAPNRCHTICFIFIFCTRPAPCGAMTIQSPVSVSLLSEWLHLSCQTWLLFPNFHELPPRYASSSFHSKPNQDDDYQHQFTMASDVRFGSMRNRNNYILPSLPRLYWHQRLWWIRYYFLCGLVKDKAIKRMNRVEWSSIGRIQWGKSFPQTISKHMCYEMRMAPWRVLAVGMEVLMAAHKCVRFRTIERPMRR